MAALVAVAGYPSLAELGNPMGYTDDTIVMEGIVHPHLELSFSTIQAQIRGGRVDSAVFSASITQMLVLSTYESVKEHREYTPVWEYFRHIRNACAHGNRFIFGRNEPIREASWRGSEIGHENRGANQPLQETQCIGKIISTADVLVLLRDIEIEMGY